MSAGKMGKMIPIRVQMLDDSITLFQVQVNDFLNGFKLNIGVQSDTF